MGHTDDAAPMGCESKRDKKEEMLRNTELASP
jgi:hypothetical protein